MSVKGSIVAIKPTIYKFSINVTDLDRNYYDTLNLTVAQHPSETLERMMVRVLVFCIEVQEGLVFTKGLSQPDEPDIWCRSLDDQLLLWIDVGEPAVDRIKKATRIAKVVKVFSFNNKSDAWWRIEGEKFNQLAVQVFQLPWISVQTMATLVDRTSELSLTITESTAYITSNKGDCEISWSQLSSS